LGLANICQVRREAVQRPLASFSYKYTEFEEAVPANKENGAKTYK